MNTNASGNNNYNPKVSERANKSNEKNILFCRESSIDLDQSEKQRLFEYSGKITSGKIIIQSFCDFQYKKQVAKIQSESSNENITSSANSNLITLDSGKDLR